jgi:hypothetical protein
MDNINSHLDTAFLEIKGGKREKRDRELVNVRHEKSDRENRNAHEQRKGIPDIETVKSATLTA